MAQSPGDAAFARVPELIAAGDLAGAEMNLSKALALPGNGTDPFMNALLAMTYEKQGKGAEAKALWQKTYDLATAHNPPAAYARPLARTKLGR